ncbi:hypothetical protein, partial [Klebsiella pneumoniae]|uniref:hypothetical protein n=1 Tax=Klebsiella pneumoniae TaxID=573 RepID=UPI0040557F58
MSTVDIDWISNNSFIFTLVDCLPDSRLLLKVVHKVLGVPFEAEMAVQFPRLTHLLTSPSLSLHLKLQIYKSILRP